MAFKSSVVAKPKEKLKIDLVSIFVCGSVHVGLCVCVCVCVCVCCVSLQNEHIIEQVCDGCLIICTCGYAT